MSGPQMQKMETFHRLVAEEQYRDAQGILESEAEIPPQVAEKWLKWLDALYHEQRLQVGVAADQKKADPQRVLRQLIETTSGTAAVVGGSVLLWIIVVTVFSLQTASIAAGAAFIALSLPLGYLGWQYAARWLWPHADHWLGALIQFSLLIFLLTSGIPLYYYNSPPLKYLLAAFALLAPTTAYVSYRLGAGLAALLQRLFMRPDEFQAT